MGWQHSLVIIIELPQDKFASSSLQHDTRTIHTHTDHARSGPVVIVSCTDSPHAHWQGLGGDLAGSWWGLGFSGGKHADLTYGAKCNKKGFGKRKKKRSVLRSWSGVTALCPGMSGTWYWFVLTGDQHTLTSQLTTTNQVSGQQTDTHTHWGKEREMEIRDTHAPFLSANTLNRQSVLIKPHIHRGG